MSESRNRRVATTASGQQPPKKLHWKRWVLLADVVIAGVMTYLSIATLGILANLVDNVTNSHGAVSNHPVLAVFLGLFVYFVNLFIALCGTIVLLGGGFVALALYAFFSNRGTATRAQTALRVQSGQNRPNDEV